MATEYIPVIDSSWILAMIVTGGLGFILHTLFIGQTVRHYHMNNLYAGKKGSAFLLGCLLAFCFNMLACLLWVLFRTNIVVSTSPASCKIIYASNFLCYFLSKYILHCLLIFRIYMTFRGSKLQYMSLRSLALFISIVSINFFISIGVWTYSIVPNVLEGEWIVNNAHFTICTLFSDQVNQSYSVKVSAVIIGIEDFVVGTVTLIVFLKRFRQIALESHDIDLLDTSTRFAIVASIQVISTLCLFTLAIPFYPNATFILAIDATINSLCLLCVLSAGKSIYYYVFAPCRVTAEKWYQMARLYPDASASQIASYIMHSTEPNEEVKPRKTSAMKITSGGNAAIIAPCHVQTPESKPDSKPDSPKSPLRSAGAKLATILSVDVEPNSPGDGENDANAIPRSQSYKSPATAPVEVMNVFNRPTLQNQANSDPVPAVTSRLRKRAQTRDYQVVVKHVGIFTGTPAI
eukprot:68621_1